MLYPLGLYLLGLVTPLALAVCALGYAYLFQRSNQWSSCRRCHKEWGDPDTRCFVRLQDALVYWHPLVCEGWGATFWNRADTVIKARRNFKRNR